MDRYMRHRNDVKGQVITQKRVRGTGGGFNGDFNKQGNVELSKNEVQLKLNELKSKLKEVMFAELLSTMLFFLDVNVFLINRYIYLYSFIYLYICINVH